MTHEILNSLHDLLITSQRSTLNKGQKHISCST